MAMGVRLACAPDPPFETQSTCVRRAACSRRRFWRATRQGDAPNHCETRAPLRAGPLLLLFRREHHDHLAPFHLRHLLDLADFLEIGAQTLEHPHADFLVSHFAAAET